MGDHFEGIGPALKRLRKAAGLPQNQLAAKIGRSGANVSRLEQPSSNPKVSSLLRYLAAIDADLGDLNRELREHGDALEEVIACVEQQPNVRQSFRRLARGMVERFAGPEPSIALRALADLIDHQGEQLEQQGEIIGRHQDQSDDYERRLRRLEGESVGEESPEDVV